MDKNVYMVKEVWECKDSSGMTKYGCHICKGEWVETASTKEFPDGFKHCPYCAVKLQE